MFYLLTRGAVPAVIFAALYHYQVIESKLLLQALACGTGTEIILRSRVNVKGVQKNDSIEELLRGPLDLLRWYQNLLLKSTDSRLARSNIRFVRRHLPKGADFPFLCDRILNNIGAWPDPQAMTDVETEVNKLRAEFKEEQQEGSSTVALEQKYRLKLGYLILNKVGRNGFKTLLSS